MKILVLTAAAIAVLAFPALAQCLVDNNPDPTYVPAVVWYPGQQQGSKPPPRVPQWEPRPTETTVYPVALNGYWTIPIWMPVAGRCVGRFESVDDRWDATKAVEDKYLGKTGDLNGVDVLITDDDGLAAWKRQTEAYHIFAAVSRRSAGEFDVQLPAGNYVLVISNRNSLLGSKKVTLSLGGCNKCTSAEDTQPPLSEDGSPARAARCVDGIWVYLNRPDIVHPICSKNGGVLYWSYNL